MSERTLRPTRQVNVLPILQEERAALLGLLAGLSPERWETDTSCPGWTVRDLAAHLLGDDLGVLARGRDGYAGRTSSPPSTGRAWSDIVASLDQMNERWVQATRHLSGPLVTELLGFTGELLFQYFNRLDPDQPGDVVSWAGPDPAPHWLNKPGSTRKGGFTRHRSGER